jgi:hypothetical protein
MTEAAGSIFPIYDAIANTMGWQYKGASARP